MAVLIREQLVQSGALVVRSDGVVAPVGSAAGRLLCVPVSWGGHDTTLVSAYLPSGDQPACRAFIKVVWVQQWMKGISKVLCRQ